MATYQDSPWFVAENITNQNSFRLSNFGSNNAPSGYQPVKAGSQDDWNAFNAGVGTGKAVNLHNIDWNVVGGPYKDENTATAAIPGIQKQTPAPGALQQSTGVNFSSIQNALTAFYQAVTDGKRWRSLGWVLLGIVILLAGAILWIKGAIPNPLNIAVGSGPKVHLGPVSAPVIPVVLLIIGIYLAWFGIRYWDSDTKYPTDPVKSVLQGHGLPAATGQTPASGVANSVEGTNTQSDLASQQSGGAQSFANPSASQQGGTPAANKLLAQPMVASFGWTTDDYNDLILLWTQESGWNQNATNPQSGAYGIAQALGHGDSASKGSVTNEYGGFGLSDSQAQSANSGSAYWQIAWGLNYIKETYGSPSAAWKHEQSANWY